MGIVGRGIKMRRIEVSMGLIIDLNWKKDKTWFHYWRMRFKVSVLK